MNNIQVIDRSDFLKTCENLKKQNVRFLIATAYYHDEKQEKIAIVYNFDKNGQVGSIKVIVEDKKMPSLISVFGKAPEWCEREIHDHFKVDFDGLETKNRFVLPDALETDVPTFCSIKITKSEV